MRQAIADGNLVSVGDNLAFRQIKKMRGDLRDYRRVFGDVQMLRQSLRQARKDKDFERIKVCSNFLWKILFIPDYITVEAKTKSQYRKIARNGFVVNGQRFVRFSASAGNIRHNCVQFIAEDLYEPVTKALMCGLDQKITHINLAKMSAYFSLATSSVLWVSTPRVCIIDDFETTLPDQKIDWICNGSGEKKHIEERTMDLTLNSCDGQGLVDPDMATVWSDEMGLDYVASSYVVRSVFIKGNLVPFDFKQYARENGITTIYDHWKHPHNIEDIDVLVSTSQFKMYKYYSCWEEYLRFAEAAGIQWGVARYNKKRDPEMSLTNYQYIQIMDIDKEDIDQLIAPTIEWIQNICSGDDLYALLYCFGGFDGDQCVGYNDVYTRAQNLAMKAVVRDQKFLKDSYVQRKIYRNIVESINRAKLGKIWMRGNYQFMISDPIAQCRSALGLEPIGSVPADCVYSRFWSDRGLKGKEVVLLRSPCLDKHEANPCRVFANKETDKWFSWIQSGIIYSIYDTSTLRHSDSDSSIRVH